MYRTLQFADHLFAPALREGEGEGGFRRGGFLLLFTHEAASQGGRHEPDPQGAGLPSSGAGTWEPGRQPGASHHNGTPPSATLLGRQLSLAQECPQPGQCGASTSSSQAVRASGRGPTGLGDTELEEGRRPHPQNLRGSQRPAEPWPSGDLGTDPGSAPDSCALLAQLLPSQGLSFPTCKVGGMTKFRALGVVVSAGRR